MSLDIRPEVFPDFYHNIIQLASGNDNFGVGNNNPAIWLHKGTSGKLNLATLINSKHVSFDSQSLDFDVWSKITLSQQLIAGSYIYSISVNETEVYSEKKDFPVELDTVKVYAGSPDDATQQGLIRNFFVSNGNKGVEFFINYFCSLVVFFFVTSSKFFIFKKKLYKFFCTLYCISIMAIFCISK